MIGRHLVSRRVADNATLMAPNRTQSDVGYLNPRLADLVLHFDAGNPNCYSGSGTDVTDLSSGGNNGILRNGVGFEWDGGGCFTFDGTNDFIAIPHNANQNSNSLTIMTWMMRTSASGPDGNIVGKGVNQGYRFRVSGGLQFVVFDRGATNSFVVSSVTALNRWEHLVVVFTPDGCLAGRNGALLSSDPDPFGGNTTSAPLGIGSATGSSAVELFVGKVSSVQMWSAALTESEIWQHYNATKSRYYQ
jgi:hypothetical protein